MEVYLDNSATTKPRKEVIDSINYMLNEAYGNPSSLHRMGLEAEKKINESRNIISKFLKVNSEEIYFTSSGTESNNMAIQGLVNRYLKRGKHIITTKIEHSSILNIFKYYEGMGFKVTYIDVNEDGLINLQQLQDAIAEDTILVSVMMVNNEVGTIQPIKKIKDIINKYNKNIKLHVDGIQAVGKIPINLKKMGVDTFSFSGHKIHGPKGIAGLYVKKGTNINPIVFGGKQEKGLRSGTENTPGIVGIGKAVEMLNDNFENEIESIINVKKYFINGVKNNIEDIKINSFIDERGAPHILSITFKGTRGEVLLHYLERHKIYVSTASACTSNDKGKSHVLKALGLRDNEIEGTIRFSFSYLNTKKEIDYVIEKLKDSVKDIRKIIKR